MDDIVSVELPFEFSSEEVVEDKLSEKSIVPKEGAYLGLDISKSSTGYCMYIDGEKSVGNISLGEGISRDDVFYEIKLRFQLKDALSGLVKGRAFDTIVIEDAFQGINPQTTRTLYALNTVIDELVIEGCCSVRDFVRVNNEVWKSWLYRVDVGNLYRGIKDKDRIKMCLALLDVEEDENVSGYQDRLDACGMILAYLQYGRFSSKSTKVSGISKGDVVYYYYESLDVLSEEVYKERGDLDDTEYNYVKLGNKVLSQSVILGMLRESPFDVIVLEEPIVLGRLGKELGLNINFADKGYLAFWLKRKKYEKMRKGQ